MNQILDYSPIKNTGGGPSSGSDKIVRVFAVILAIFAICLLGVGTYGVYQNSTKEEQVVDAPTKAQITVEQNEENGEAIIRATHDKIISKLIYNLNSNKEIQISGNNKSTVETTAQLSIGTNTLTVKVIDVDGVETHYEQILNSEVGADKEPPKIVTEIQGNMLKVVATDETEMGFVTYRWNDGEEVRFEPNEDDKTRIEFEIEILKDQNHLLIVAVDSSNNPSQESNNYTGVTKPTGTVTLSPDKKSIDVYVYHEKGLKEIQLSINNQNYEVPLPEENQKEITFNVTLEAEQNTVKVVATSVDNTKAEIVEEITREPENVPDVIEISIEKNEENPEIADFYAKCESGIKEVRLNVNDVEYEMTLPVENPPDITFPLTLLEGNNKIKFTVISVNGTEKQEIKEITR